MREPPAVRPNVAPSLFVMRVSDARAAASPPSRDRDRLRRVDRAAGRIVELEVRRVRRIAKELRIGRSGERDLLARARRARARPRRSARSRRRRDRSSTSTRRCFPFITRNPAARCPASSTSSGSPRRTFAESSAPDRRTHSATVAPRYVARCDDGDLRARGARRVALSMRNAPRKLYDDMDGSLAPDPVCRPADWASRPAGSALRPDASDGEASQEFRDLRERHLFGREARAHDRAGHSVARRRSPRIR